MRLKRILLGGVLGALLLMTSCQPAPTLEITFGGDIMLARDGMPLFEESPWSEFVPSEETLFFANLESPLSDREASGKTEGYNLCADARQIEILKTGGVDLVTTANNHQGDCGEAESTAAILDAGLIQNVNEATSPLYLQTRVGVVGVIAFDAVTSHLDLDEVLYLVEAAKPHCDFLVVSLHWGFEYVVEPSSTQREWAQKLSDAGVDVLWGHHPHVLQPLEWVDASEGDHQMVAMYSLGNLLADQWMTWDTQHSALVTLRVTKAGVDSLNVWPFHMDPASRRLVSPSSDSIERIEARLANPSEIVDSPLRP